MILIYYINYNNILYNIIVFINLTVDIDDILVLKLIASVLSSIFTAWDINYRIIYITIKLISIHQLLFQT